MVEEKVYTSRDLPPDLKSQILCFLRIMWPEGFRGKNRLRDWITPEEDHPISIVLVESGILISHTQVVWRQLEHAGVTYKAYGLTGVFTYPAFRGQGYGKRVVELGTARILAGDGDLGIFHCDHSLREFYAGLGWIPMETAVTLEGPRESPAVNSELMMMRYLTPHGAEGRKAFESLPLYFGEYTW